MDLPLEYRWLVANGFKGFVPWHLADESQIEALRSEYQKETGEDFYPFAQRQDCDDVAGFKVENGVVQPNVVYVHLTWSGRNENNGYPTRTEFSDMFGWVKEVVIEDTVDWMSEEDLKEIQ
ncbi:MAG: hypothetical protein AB2733_11855 [Candidatus Thiodiazotropha taylori]